MVALAAHNPQCPTALLRQQHIACSPAAFAPQAVCLRLWRCAPGEMRTKKTLHEERPPVQLGHDVPGDAGNMHVHKCRKVARRLLADVQVCGSMNVHAILPFPRPVEGQEEGRI